MTFFCDRVRIIQPGFDQKLQLGSLLKNKSGSEKGNDIFTVQSNLKFYFLLCYQSYFDGKSRLFYFNTFCLVKSANMFQRKR